MSTWFPEQPKAWYHRMCLRILGFGQIPKHVAVIMDGNRRFAVKNSMERAEGHLKGFDKLTEVLEWCLDIGITEVTVYAFSIENFKRSKAEVDCLMELARKKFKRLMEEKDKIQEYGVCVRVLGNVSLLPNDIQEIIAEVVTYSKDNTRAILNVCFAYTSRDEMCTAMKEIAEGVSLGLIKDSDVSEALLEKSLYTGNSPNPDLLVRTSGEVRLSDFLLWQTAYSCLAFVKVLWPEFSRWHLYGCILHYQRNYKQLQKAKEQNEADQIRLQREKDYEIVAQQMDQSETESIHTVAKQYANDRENRVNNFVQYLHNKRDKFFHDIAAKSKKSMT